MPERRCKTEREISVREIRWKSQTACQTEASPRTSCWAADGELPNSEIGLTALEYELFERASSEKSDNLLPLLR